MHFATPIWLLGLIPWTALAVWMLWGRRERVAVPFLALWRDGDARPASKRVVQPPPIAIVLLLLAILLAVLAAGSPTIFAPGFEPTTVVIDRGITMSAREGDTYRYVLAVRQLADAIDRAGGVFVLPVPGIERMTDWTRLASDVDAIPPTALDTSGDIKQAALRALHARAGRVVVVTDQSLDISDDRLIVVPPSALTSNAGITHVAAREKPAEQVMVRVDAHPPSKQTIVVTSDGQRLEQTMDAPGTAFIDVHRLGKTVDLALAQGDALQADDRAWLVRESSWPRIEPVVALPAELARMVETYRKLRPSREEARVVAIVAKPQDAAGDAVLIAPGESAVGGVAPAVVVHPVTVGVEWPGVLQTARIGSAAPVGFTPLVSSGDGVAVAVQETPGRQVWVSLDSATFPRRADYVVFWTNVFDWLGRGGDAFVAHPVGLLGDGWRRITDGPGGTEPGLWPGLYERGDGTLRAVNAPRVTLAPSTPASDWRQRLAQLPSRRGEGRAIAPYLLLLALACALGATLWWPARRAAQT